MCKTSKFGVHFKLDVECIDEEHNVIIPLIARRKELGVIPPIGMHIFFNPFEVEIIGIIAPQSFDVVTCKCRMNKNKILTSEEVCELLKLGWKEEVESYGVPKTKCIFGKYEVVANINK